MNSFKPILIITILSFFGLLKAQQGLGNRYMGNGLVNYHNNRMGLQTPTFNREKVFHSKGILKVKPDGYMAIFSLVHIGSTVEETNKVTEAMINPAISQIKSEIKDVKVLVDMIRFLPKYEVEVQKKLFSKKTFKEIPKGFEVQKNIHIRFTNPDNLNKIIEIMAEYEIYDFVKVENIRSDIFVQKEKLMNQVIENLKKKLERYTSLTKMKTETYNKDFAEKLDVFYPPELYEMYQQRTSYNIKGDVQFTEKPEVYYFNTLQLKDYDVEIFEIENQEPTIEIVYQASLRLVEKPKENLDDAKVETKIEKEVYYLNTQNGQMQKMPK